MEQCTHLVRISEQRRQENLSLQAKMRVMENKSREYLQQKEATASSAVVGLSGLGNRLDSLLDRLVKSYSISEEDIEVCKMCLVSFLCLLNNYFISKICFCRMKFTSMKRIQMETVVVIPNNIMEHLINQTLKALCLLLFLP